MSSKAMKQLLFTKLASPFEIATTPIPSPAPNEFLIKIHSVGINPLDFKLWQANFFNIPLPAVLGSEASGTIISVGSEITKFKSGDHVFGVFNNAAAGPSNHAFNEYAIASDEAQWAKKPESMSSSDAAAIPIIYETAAAAVVYGLGLGISAADFHPLSDNTLKQAPKSVLVLGGASGVGAAVLEILHTIAPETVLLTTCSPRNADLVKSLGAQHAVDYNTEDVVSQVKSLTNGKGVEVIIDAVGGAKEQPSVIEALSEHSKKFIEVATGVPFDLKNKSVQAKMVFATDVSKVNGGKTVFDGLAKWMDKGGFKVPIKVDVRKGFGELPKAIEDVGKANSARKIVVEF